MNRTPTSSCRLWGFTRIEALIVVAIIAIAVLLLLPGQKWGSSGTLETPVRVFVFDAESMEPISSARVTILFAPIAHAEMDFESLKDRVPEDLVTQPASDRILLTGQDGVAQFPFRFETSAGHNRPKPHAHVHFYWLAVAAEGYGTVVVPLRYESVPTAKLKDGGELFVTVGLLPAE